MVKTKAKSGTALASSGICPRGLDAASAAAYVGLSKTAFLREVAARTMPGPLPLASRRRIWDIAALNAALDRLTGRGIAGLSPLTDDPIMDQIRAGS